MLHFKKGHFVSLFTKNKNEYLFELTVHVSREHNRPKTVTPYD